METIAQFRKTVWDYYKEHKRDFEWRQTTDSYRILVSEIMLQQTQVSRVKQKYREFIDTFPDFNALARAPLQRILSVWQGMGYNRRALYLQRCAQLVMQKYNGVLPNDPTILETFPGIGRATARSVVCFAWNKPVVFIETNIRRVFIYHFFKDKVNVSDAELLPYVKRALDQANPREWYYGLMDYGTYLAKRETNPNRRSKHYIKQSKFEGSNRQIRGILLGYLTTQREVSKSLLEKEFFAFQKERIYKNLQALINEGFIKKENETYQLK